MGKHNNSTEKIQKYTVQKIVDQKIVSGKKYYLIKWQGYPMSQNTWQPQDNIQFQPTQQSTIKKSKPKPQKLLTKPRLTRQRVKQKQQIKRLKIQLHPKKSIYFASKQKQEQYEMQQIKKKQQNQTMGKKLKEFNKSINKKHKTKRIKKVIKNNGNKQLKVKKIKEQDSSDKNEQIIVPQNMVEGQQQQKQQQVKNTQKIVQELIQQQQQINIVNNEQQAKQQAKQQQQQQKKCPLQLMNKLLEKQLNQLNENNRTRRIIKKKDPYEVKDIIKQKPKPKKNNLIHWRTKAKRLNETTQLYRINVSEQYRQLILSKPPRIEQQGKQQIQQQIIQSSSESINDQNTKMIPDDFVKDVLGQTKNDCQKMYKIELFDGRYRQICHVNLRELFPKKLCDYQEKKIKYLEQLNN